MFCLGVAPLFGPVSSYRGSPLPAPWRLPLIGRVDWSCLRLWLRYHSVSGCSPVGLNLGTMPLLVLPPVSPRLGRLDVSASLWPTCSLVHLRLGFTKLGLLDVFRPYLLVALISPPKSCECFLMLPPCARQLLRVLLCVGLLMA
ncbi:unnamed protein product [Dovyalis caffra]|uniref:Secreted protein n=1 Tax=Dovyalis caffra TaxID=77055 RepID=A0AAV1SK12_9ROSI|nr:unnamed protein product [Dovyalis caffra]